MTIISFFVIEKNSVKASISGFLVNYINYFLCIFVLNSLNKICGCNVESGKYKVFKGDFYLWQDLIDLVVDLTETCKI